MNKNIFEIKILGFKILSVHVETNVMRKKVASDIKNVAKDMLGVLKEKSTNNKNN